jgi:hypothetical protein
MATVADRIEGDATVSIGRVFSRAVSFVVKYPLISFGSAALFGALPSVVNEIFVASTVSLAEDGPAPIDALTGMVAIRIFFAVVAVVLSGLMQAVITRGLIDAHEGRRPTFGQCLVDGLRFAIPVVLVTLLWSLGLGLGFMLLVVPGAILLSMWAVAIPALVEERTGILGAFGRSRELTRGSRWKVFGLLLVLLVVFYLVIGFAAVLGGIGAPLKGAATVLSGITGLFSGLLWAVVQPSLFVELRDAKEGGGTAELAQLFS